MAKKKDSVVGSGPSPNRRVLTTVDDKTQTIYANNAAVEVSNWDIKLRLGLIQSATPEAVNVRDLVHVYMSHEHAKAFAESLTATLLKFETIRQQAAAAAGSVQ